MDTFLFFNKDCLPVTKNTGTETTKYIFFDQRVAKHIWEDKEGILKTRGVSGPDTINDRESKTEAPHRPPQKKKEKRRH